MILVYPEREMTSRHVPHKNVSMVHAKVTPIYIIKLHTSSSGANELCLLLSIGVKYFGRRGIGQACG
jgi:hypothetical protein